MVLIYAPFVRYLGDGPKLVRELFRVADEMSPTLVFIDEIDAVGSKRYDSNSGGTREIQRTMLELLNQLDGFDERGDVKVGNTLICRFRGAPSVQTNGCFTLSRSWVYRVDGGIRRPRGWEELSPYFLK